MPDAPAPANPLLVSTRNAHKVAEIRAILGPGFDVRDLTAVPDLAEVEETGSTFEENATLKAVAASLRFDGWVIADDSGLEVDALDGAPGVRSARFAGEPSNDAANNALLLQRLEGIRGKERSARFRCVIVLARNGRKLGAFHGTVEGTIIHQPKGNGGFGYDPLFVPDGHCETFAQLGSEAKNTLSHRSRALAGLQSWGGWDRIA
ncbi:MAG: RdgB/HAM1 family non-canonical purine NTP pyrophosphatase [Terrimicrobiaceae bacterium]|nr:RdgB/HAM1 family non-canonical purine NTP pyrophosphatase [Terrimicrobiaceae bacterium]